MEIWRLEAVARNIEQGIIPYVAKNEPHTELRRYKYLKGSDFG
jgi:hypothetical protein